MKIDDHVLNTLKKDANKAFRRGEIPVSAVIVDSEGKIISHSCNNRQKSCNVLGHAEISCILKAEKKIHDWRLNGYKLYVTLEPCDMCSMVIKESRIDEVFYFLPKKNTNTPDLVSINKSEIEGYDKDKEYFNNLLTSFFDNKR